MRRLCTLILFSICTLFGCSTLSEYSPYTEKSPKHEPNLVIENPWWQAFADPLMNILADELLAQNLDIQIARSRLAEAKGLAKIATANLFPDIMLTGNGSRLNNQLGLTKPATIIQGGFNASWELDLFGRTAASINAAEQRVNANLATVEDIANAMLAECFRSIVEWREARERVSKTLELLSIQDQQVALFTSQAKAGLVDVSLMERALAQRSETATQLPLAESAANSAQFKLERLLAMHSGELTNTLNQYQAKLSYPEPNQSLNIAIDILKNRPDVRAAYAQMLASQADLAKAEAELWPNVSLSGFFGVQNLSDFLPNPGNPIWSMASNVSAPLLNFGRLRGAIEANNARAVAACLTYENTLLIALQEAKTALSDYLQGVNAVVSLQNSLQHRQITIDLTMARFTHGLTDMVDLTTAQRELNEVTLTLINRKATTAIAYIRLQKALGITFESPINPVVVK